MMAYHDNISCSSGSSGSATTAALRSMQRQVLACDAPDATDQGLAALAKLLAAQDPAAPTPGRAP